MIAAPALDGYVFTTMADLGDIDLRAEAHRVAWTASTRTGHDVRTTMATWPYRADLDIIVTTPDGGLITAWYRNRDDIVRLNSGGQVVLSIPKAISSITDHSELDTRVAADGLGNIYALGTFNSAVFKFTSEGKFVNKFGSAGDQPGQLRAPHAIAVDGKGRVFVSDIKGVQVFDSNGRFLQLFKTEGPASGMVFNDKNELFVAARKQVMKFVLN